MLSPFCFKELPMSTPLSDHYKGFEIHVQAMRRAKDRDDPDDGPRHFDIVVTI